uniref:Death domain-containing protein n=1 Tax=Amphimedon queenslandica TaxID=400682 RepID=A0A1X7SX44_AMPQE
LLIKLRRWLEAYMHRNDKLTNASLDETFKSICPFYDFIDCSLIVDMSEVFLQDFKFGDDELSIVSELRNYKEKADKLRFSAQVKHLHESFQIVYEEHICDTSNMPMILMKLHNQWHGSNLNGLSLLIHKLLPVGHQQSIMKYITISSGCILIKYSVHGSTADILIKYTEGKLQFMRLIGIFGLYINDHPVLQEDENMNFTFELALLEAVTAGNNEAVEFLLQLETVNIDHTNEEGKTALMLASEKGHEDIVHSLLSAGANVNIQDNKDVPDISELNPGPMIDDRPNISLLIQWLEPLVNWKQFGCCLPGITYSDISKIEAENKKIDEQKSALYSKWLTVAPKATWADVINALSKRKENKFVREIRRNLQKSALRSATGYAVSTRLPPQTIVRFHMAEDEKEILRTLIDLKEKFSILVMHVQF